MIDLLMEKRSPFRIYGNQIRERGIPAAELAEPYLQMISSWDQTTIKDMYYEFSVDRLKADLRLWQWKGKLNVCRAIYELVAEKDA